MRKNDVITIEIERHDFESLLGFLSESIAKLKKTEAVLTDVIDIIRIAAQEDSPEETPDCDSCYIPCDKNPNYEKDAKLYSEYIRLFHQLKQDSDDERHNKVCEESVKRAEEYLTSEEKGPEPDEACKAFDEEALTMEILKAVFAALKDLIDSEN